MARASSEPLYVSRNHLEGSLCDTSLDRVMAACRKHLVTGVIRVHVRGRDGVIELRAGAVDRATFGDLAGDIAMSVMRASTDGWYEVAQRLPDLTGDLGAAAQLEGDVEGVPLIALMRHCEDHALTCTITVVSGFDRACIDYRAGEIARVELNGFFDDDDALPQILQWPDARFRVAAPPLDLDIEGWPITRRAPTMPFFVGKRKNASASGEIMTAGARFDVSDEGGEDTLPDLIVPAAPPPAPHARPGRDRARSTIESSLSAYLDPAADVLAVPAPKRLPRATPAPPLALPLPPPGAPPRPAPVLRAETHRTRRKRLPRALTPGYDWGHAFDLAWFVLGLALLVGLIAATMVLLA